MLDRLRPKSALDWIRVGLAGFSFLLFLVNTLLISSSPTWVGVVALLLGFTFVAILTFARWTVGPGKPKQLVLVSLGSSALFLVCFGLFAYWTFPWDRVRDFLVQSVEQTRGPDGRSRPSGLELDIEELSPSWITGVEMTGVRVTKLPEDPEGEPLVIEIDEASARVSILALLSGGVGASFALDVGGGTISGDFEESDALTSVHAELERVDLRKLGIMRSLIGLPVTGKLDGELDLVLPEEARDASGSGSLTISDLRVGDGRSKLALAGMGDGITIEQIDAGEVRLAFSVEEGAARISELRADGTDLELAGEGSVRLARPLSTSRVDLLVRLRFKDAYRTRNDRTRGLFAILDMAPQLRAARAPDGALQYRINGVVGGRIGPTPAGRARPPGHGDAAPGPGGAAPAEVGD